MHVLQIARAVHEDHGSAIRRHTRRPIDARRHLGAVARRDHHDLRLDPVVRLELGRRTVGGFTRRAATARRLEVQLRRLVRRRMHHGQHGPVGRAIHVLTALGARQTGARAARHVERVEVDLAEIAFVGVNEERPSVARQLGGLHFPRPVGQRASGAARGGHQVEMRVAALFAAVVDRVPVAQKAGRVGQRSAEPGIVVQLRHDAHHA